MKSNFFGIARDHGRQSELLGSDSSRSPSPVYHRSSRPFKNHSKFRIAYFNRTDCKLWFNQIETQFDLYDITDDDERYRLTCAALSDEVASDVHDVLLHSKIPQPQGGINRKKRSDNVGTSKQSYFERETRSRHSFLFSQTPSQDFRFRGICSCRQNRHMQGFHTTEADTRQSPFSYTARQNIAGESSQP